MLYTKIKLKDGTAVTADIRHDNTFTKCNKCGKEIPVCLSRLFHSGCTEPLTAKIVCADCTKKKLEPQITLNKVVEFASSLAEIGFEKELISVFEDFDIVDLNQLKAEDYQDFVIAILTAISHADNGRC